MSWYTRTLRCSHCDILFSQPCVNGFKSYLQCEVELNLWGMHGPNQRISILWCCILNLSKQSVLLSMISRDNAIACIMNHTMHDHYNDVIMGAIASQITRLTIVYSIVYSDADQRKHQSSASLAFVWGIHRGPVNSPHKWPVMRKMFPFDDVIMMLLDLHHVRVKASHFTSHLTVCSKDCPG